MTGRSAVSCSAIALLAVTLAGPAAADEASARPAVTEAHSRAGAGTPGLGGLDLTGGAGMIFILPHITLGATLGLGGGAAVELRYRTIAALGHGGRLRFAWSTKVRDGLIYGVSARTSITSLKLADAGIIGIQFSNIAVGNDWEVGGDMALTWVRPGRAHVTASIGPTWTLGGIRYLGFDESEFRIEPGPRAIMLGVSGEWEVRSRVSMFLSLDGAILVGTEIMPIGFIPTGTVGFSWSVH